MSQSEKLKTKLEIAEERKAKLIAEAAKARDKVNNLKAKARRLESRENRAKENRLKNHIGGIVGMTGLSGYVYPDGVQRDNEQDELIENLLVGVLLKVGFSLEKASVDDLKILWEQGRDFRKLKKADRVLPKVNSNLNLLFQKLNLNITDTKQQPNDNEN